MHFKALKYALPLVVYIGAWFSFTSRGWVIYLPIIYAFVFIPLVELWLKPNPANLDAAEEAVARREWLYNVLLYAIVPMQYLALWWFLQSVQQPGLQGWEVAGRIAVMGLLCGSFGINVGHELGHRGTWYEQWMAKALLLTSLYTHFFIEHNKGHHKHVSTPTDPSSAPRGMSLYRFWVRSITGVYLGAWHIAASDAKKAGLAALHLKNEMVQLQLITLLWVAAIGWWWGPAVLGYYALAALLGILLLETVNYIEHYGLSRKPTGLGSFERARPVHSWNSNHILGRLMLFELSRHSDHHYLASRPYQILRHHEEAPQLPTGYPGSMLLATLPPLWFKVMHRQMVKQGVG
ncbi:MAG TPA: alkane 1-monooxygenase [Phnomibacter sp.]|nr:alkane 1-monooxygenase [Phnomibacter sp.]